MHHNVQQQQQKSNHWHQFIHKLRNFMHIISM